MGKPKRAMQDETEGEIVIVDASPLVRTTIRQKITPLLPPPVVSAMRNLDPRLEPYVGPEASITLVGSLVLGVLVLQLIKIFSGLSGAGRAIVDEDEDVILKESLGKDEYGDTVLLCGPSGGGKTRLFYAFCYDKSQVPTVTSVKSNIGLIQNNQDDGKPVRLVDYPGHASWGSPQIRDILQSVERLVLVMDSTQPVAPAADALYQIFSHAACNKKRPSVLVDCHKADAPNAKNFRRIKIQLRTELERLLKVRAIETDGDVWWPPGKPLDLDSLDCAQLHFGSVSCQTSQQGMEELREFILTGQLSGKTFKTAKVAVV